MKLCVLMAQDTDGFLCYIGFYHINPSCHLCSIGCWSPVHLPAENHTK